MGQKEQTIKPAPLKTAKDYSFGAWVDAGKTKEEIMKRFVMTEKQYEKSMADLKRIREEKHVL